MLSVSYALPAIESEDDPIVSYIDDFMHRLERAAHPGEYLVEIFPILNYLPPFLAKWKRDGQARHKEDKENFMTWYRDAVSRAVGLQRLNRYLHTINVNERMQENVDLVLVNFSRKTLS